MADYSMIPSSWSAGFDGPDRTRGKWVSGAQAAIHSSVIISSNLLFSLRAIKNKTHGAVCRYLRITWVSGAFGTGLSRY